MSCFGFHSPLCIILVIAKTTSFKGSNLQGCRFYKAYLVGADFMDADLRGASLEDTSMDDAILTNANAAGAYFGPSILDAKSLENVDFTDAQIPLKTVPQLVSKVDGFCCTKRWIVLLFLLLCCLLAELFLILSLSLSVSVTM
jgi:hypothetical protein